MDEEFQGNNLKVQDLNVFEILGILFSFRFIISLLFVSFYGPYTAYQKLNKFISR